MSDVLLVELRRSLVRPSGFLVYTERTLMDPHLSLVRGLADRIRSTVALCPGLLDALARPR
jgi:hypothetical protein